MKKLQKKNDANVMISILLIPASKFILIVRLHPSLVADERDVRARSLKKVVMTTRAW